MKVGEEEVEINETVGVKQGDNLGPILFILLIQDVTSTLDKGPSLPPISESTRSR